MQKKMRGRKYFFKGGRSGNPDASLEETVQLYIATLLSASAGNAVIKNTPERTDLACQPREASILLPCGSALPGRQAEAPQEQTYRRTLPAG